MIDCKECNYYNEDDNNCGAFECNGLECPKLPCEIDDKECYKQEKENG